MSEKDPSMRTELDPTSEGSRSVAMNQGKNDLPPLPDFLFYDDEYEGVYVAYEDAYDVTDMLRKYLDELGKEFPKSEKELPDFLTMDEEGYVQIGGEEDFDFTDEFKRWYKNLPDKE